MAKTLTEAAITTRNARAKLEPGLYFKGIDPEVHLGYRKGKRGGVWLVRWRNWGPGANYLQTPLGTADDELKEGTLDYEGARRAARAAVEKARAETKAAAQGPALTVRLAVEAYIADRDARDSRRKGRQVRSDGGRRLTRYILGQPTRGRGKAIAAAPLADVALYALKEADLLSWRADLPDAMKATTKQRLINDLKAALNGAYTAHRDRLDANVPAVVKHGLKAAARDDDSVSVARDNQILTDGQIRKLIGAAREIDTEYAWDGDLFRLVVVLAATGARFSQISRMRVSDVQRAAGRLMLPVSRKGRGGKSGSVPIPVGKDVLDALIPAVMGRGKDAPLFERWRHKQVAGSIRWERDKRGPWQSVSELARPWDAIRERAKMPQVIPYALRHSSVVRGVRQNLPIRLVAALHDTSVPMIERHYGRYIADGLEELAARAIVPLVPAVDGDKVIRMAENRS
ncbi:Phage integrase family protein [Mesorhizobium albiziae]|uniref:Phage integrase family protein n=1 Tax=Neomesorhizobium albiziae TaxID=335020 RepID=A0A1I3XBQ7_9HYPH|nr:tyrosine-type recombinase/integrase [Mesorhizobium albiziae]GLS30563.1 hypothetical protein GCM10007937_22710 [Mesorhizobium albiziae]SFK16982.1 Phage integrase family protein [Mesorhizobium albiziae]